MAKTVFASSAGLVTIVSADMNKPGVVAGVIACPLKFYRQCVYPGSIQRTIIAFSRDAKFYAVFSCMI